MFNISILRKGDAVLCINDRFLAVKRKNGEVDIFKVLFNEKDEFLIDPVKTATIGFGEGTVSSDMEDGETTVYTF